MSDLPFQTLGYDVCFKTAIFLPEARPGRTEELFWLFTSRDPYAVEMLIVRDGDPQLWSVSREVLLACLNTREAAGIGDFVIEPNVRYAEIATGPTLLVHFTGTDEDAYEIHEHAFVIEEHLQRFLDATLKCVPEGTESNAYDWNELLK